MVSAFLAMAFVAGFINPAKAAEKNKPVTIYVLFDNGVDDTLQSRQAKSQAQLSDWMDNDLVRVFARYAKSGYQAKLIKSRGDFPSQPDNYLLSVKITGYSAGSKAARIIVGFGAGGVSLKVHYELLANGKNTLLSKDDQTRSGREWINAARKLNQNIAETVIKKLQGK